MPNRRANDPIGNRKFRVEIEGVTTSAFRECEGLEVEIDIVEFKEDDELIGRKIPGQVRYSNIILKRGYTANDDLWLWIKSVLDGKIERRSGSIILLAEDASEITRFNFFEAWPCRWKGFVLDTASTGASIEELEIAVEKIEKV
ncbi:MAG: phage tail protein [Granulosicoccus sp.]